MPYTKCQLMDGVQKLGLCEYSKFQIELISYSSIQLETSTII